MAADILNDRFVGNLEEYVCDTGIRIRLRKVSPLLVAAIQKAFPPPEPPTQTVDYGDGVKRIEANPAHPDYTQALADHAALIDEKARRVMLLRGIDVEVDQGAVQTLRADMAAIGVELDPDDTYVYITGICLGTAEDCNDIIQRITRRSQPTAQAVEEATKSL